MACKRDLLFTLIGMPTQFGSSRYVGHSSELDSAIVAILRKAGCLIMGF